ncbi:unnamed protein product [Cuscuta epithymum]|uniref:DNA-directed RNA polymerase III subunit RPC9 n=1 Tax=Cuscuta epithymum TaxID=186058 RepID=A0AAV0D8D0_9ASTE|nr:unnamed protein product [Cuscuta epithymum]
MRILKANAGALTNFEVLEFLRSRGAGKGAARVMLPILASEFKVFDYLEQTAVCSNQTREIIGQFVEKCKSFNISKAEVLNIINIRPCTLSQIYPIIEEYDVRFPRSEETGDEEESEEPLMALVETILHVLPAPPSPMQEADGEVDEKVDEQMETSADENRVVETNE